MIFQHSSLTYCILIIKYQSSFISKHSCQSNLYSSFWNFIWFFTEDNSVLEVALEINLRGQVAYKPVACKKVYLENISPYFFVVNACLYLQYIYTLMFKTICSHWHKFLMLFLQYWQYIFTSLKLARRCYKALQSYRLVFSQEVFVSCNLLYVRIPKLFQHNLHLNWKYLSSL